MSTATSDRYYVPHSSYWPIITTLGLFMLALGAANWLNGSSTGGYLALVGVAVLLFITVGWFGTVVKESVAGMYNNHVDLSFRQSMGWFIFSEVMLFAVFFGALFYLRQLSIEWLASDEVLWPGYDGGWPTAGPAGALPLPADTPVAAGENAFSTIGWSGLPLLNTVILMISSVTLTISHHALKEDKRGSCIIWMAITVALGATFLFFQGTEYIHAYHELGLTLESGVYGGTFFMLTGLHGIHVTIGTIMLFVILLRLLKGHFTADYHFGYEASAWYWHFVDVVWVGLFIFVYIL
ncbi:cytochrome c oxidase subunit 3 [Gammaproteobacteria bacterium]|nr:cytochrome c oxidase subunit 3 [Gammaproteobacteria bacterium]